MAMQQIVALWVYPVCEFESHTTPECVIGRCSEDGFMHLSHKEEVVGSIPTLHPMFFYLVIFFIYFSSSSSFVRTTRQCAENSKKEVVQVDNFPK